MPVDVGGGADASSTAPAGCAGVWCSATQATTQAVSGVPVAGGAVSGTVSALGSIVGGATAALPAPLGSGTSPVAPGTLSGVTSTVAGVLSGAGG